MNPDAARWNERYRESSRENRESKQLLRDNIHLLPESGKALDVACGTGINGLLLAERGMDVFFYDISFAGMTIAREKCRAAGVSFMGAVTDLRLTRFPADFFDVILNFSFLERSILPHLRRALKINGILFFETLVKSGSFQSHRYLDEGEADQLFQGYEILFRGKRAFYKDGELYKLSDQLIGRKINETGDTLRHP